MMIVSPRLTRAGLVFLLFGTVAALLPSLDTTALAENDCFTGPPGSKGQFAIAYSSSHIQEAYLLTPTAITYRHYYKTPPASTYTVLATGITTTFVVNSGQISINGSSYSTSSQPGYTSAASFTAAQVVTSRNFSGLPTGYAAGDVTLTSTYVGSDASGHQDTYIAVVNLSAP